METVSKFEHVCQFLVETYVAKVCSIIIKSRFFNSNKILHLCNTVLEQSVQVATLVNIFSLNLGP